MEEPPTGNTGSEHLAEQGQTSDDQEDGEDENTLEDLVEDNQDEEDEDDEDDEDDEVLHALPILGHHPQVGNNFAGRGRGRGRGRGGMAFSGAGHSLGSTSSTTTPVIQASAETSTADQGAIRRQRILDAMAARERDPAAVVPKEAQAPKKIKTRDMPTLQSLCSYEVAGMLCCRPLYL